MGVTSGDGESTPRLLDSNSSTTALNNGEVFTGAWQDVSSYDSVVVAVKTDQNGTYTVQFSPDGTNQDSTLTRYYRTTQIEPPHRFTITRKYCRVVFTNDSGSNQTYFRLQTSVGSKTPLNVPVDAVVSPDYDATVVRPTDYKSEVALGRRQGAELWNKFGYNNDIDTTTDPEIIASWGGTFSYDTTGSTLTIVSTDTADNGTSSPLGTGTQQVIIWGVDENWDEVIEIIALNGTTPVTTTNSFIGVNRMSVYLNGTGTSNAGTISAFTTASPTTQLAEMPAGEGTTQQLIFYVPADAQFLAEWLYFGILKVSGGNHPDVTIKGWVYSDVAKAEFEVYRDALDVQRLNHIKVEPPLPFVIGEKSIIWFTAETTLDNTAIRGRMSGILHRDVDS